MLKFPLQHIYILFRPNHLNIFYAYFLIPSNRILTITVLNKKNNVEDIITLKDNKGYSLVHCLTGYYKTKQFGDIIIRHAPRYLIQFSKMKNIITSS
jgi:hypothetical protein